VGGRRRPAVDRVGEGAQGRLEQHVRETKSAR
jgi:hypothetical protein